MDNRTEAELNQSVQHLLLVVSRDNRSQTKQCFLCFLIELMVNLAREERSIF